MNTIRHAEISDLDPLSSIEAACFPQSEACGRNQMKKRLETYPDWFFIQELNGRIVSFADGLVSDKRDLSDSMYEDVHEHTSDGTWLMILGVDTDPAYQHHGYASMCLNAAVHQAEQAHLNGVVLTCKKKLISFYEQFGFLNEGISESVHGNVTWYQMRLAFEKRKEL